MEAEAAAAATSTRGFSTLPSTPLVLGAAVAVVNALFVRAEASAGSAHGNLAEKGGLFDDGNMVGRFEVKSSGGERRSCC